MQLCRGVLLYTQYLFSYCPLTRAEGRDDHAQLDQTKILGWRDDELFSELELTEEQEEINRLVEIIERLEFDLECLREENEELREVDFRIPY